MQIRSEMRVTSVRDTFSNLREKCREVWFEQPIRHYTKEMRLSPSEESMVSALFGEASRQLKFIARVLDASLPFP
jgi:hypothetical protein